MHLTVAFMSHALYILKKFYTLFFPFHFPVSRVFQCKKLILCECQFTMQKISVYTHSHIQLLDCILQLRVSLFFVENFFSPTSNHCLITLVEKALLLKRCKRIWYKQSLKLMNRITDWCYLIDYIRPFRLKYKKMYSLNVWKKSVC